MFLNYKIHLSKQQKHHKKYYRFSSLLKMFPNSKLLYGRFLPKHPLYHSDQRYMSQSCLFVLRAITYGFQLKYSHTILIPLNVVLDNWRRYFSIFSRKNTLLTNKVMNLQVAFYIEVYLSTNVILQEIRNNSFYLHTYIRLNIDIAF